MPGRYREIETDQHNSFVRFQSLNLMDANNTQYPAEAFSSLFTYVDIVCLSVPQADFSPLASLA